MTCPSCGDEVPEGARFCSSCGLALAEREDDQRRVVTVLFADLVGFTTMSEGTDPEQVKRVVDGCFEELVGVVETFGGRVDKIIGDAILALFGAPVGHEDDAERAVRAALRMQETLAGRETSAQLQLRIGVNTGEVLVGALRSGGDYTAMGDVVNTAQRLQSAARPGQVLVGSATYLAAGDSISYESLGPLRVRGRGERVEAWRALDTLQPPGRRARRVGGPLVGRRSEMTVLTGEIDLAVQRRRAQVSLLIGDAGVGKSRLASELVAYARDRYDAWVLEGHCVPYGEANVWWPVADALRQATGLDADAGTVEARAAVTELAARLKGVPADDPDVIRITDGIVELLGYESALRDIDAGRAREESMRALIELTDAAAADRPVVVVLSDLHWADQVVLDTIDQLTARVGRNPYVIIGTARPAIHDRWAPTPGRHNTTIQHLEPLERDAADSLLNLLAAEPLEPEVRADLLDRSGGNPFFIEELLTLLDETGTMTSPALATPDADHDVAELSGLPDSLRGLVVARLDALSGAERAVVEDAAVLGRSGPLDGLHIMGRVSRSVDDVTEAVDSLVAKEVLRTEDGTWTFRSDLVRDVAYGTMTKSRRAVSHAGVAAWFEANLAGPDARDSVIDRIAHHYGTAASLVADMGAVDGVPDDIDDRALEWINEASARALSSEHHLAGARLFTHALDLLGDERSAARWEALIGRSHCRVHLRDIDGALQDAQAVLDEADAAADPVLVGRALTALGDAQQKAGDTALARRTLTEAVDRLGEVGADRERGEALRYRGMAELFADEYEAAESSISAALDVARQVGDRKGEAWALQNLAWLAFETGRAHDAEQWIEQSVAAFTEIGDSGGLGWALGLSAWVKLHLGARDEAVEVANRLLPDSRSRGDHWAEAMMRMLLASGHLWSGRAATSLDPAERAEELFERTGDQGGVAQARVTQARALLMRGRADEAMVLIDSTVATERTDRDGFDVDRTGLIGAVLGSVAIGDPLRAQAVIDRLDAPGIDLDEIGGVDLVSGLSLAHLQQGEVALAGGLVDRLDLDAADTSPALAAIGALVDVARGAGESARELAAAVPEAMRSTFLDRAQAAMAMGLLEAAEGDAAASSTWFDRAESELAPSDDRLDKAVVALARAEAAAFLGADDAEVFAEVADRSWRSMDLDPSGWRIAFTLCLEPARTG